MKRPRSTTRDLLRACVRIVVVYVVLLIVMERTQMIEKVMGANFAWWELVLIVVFIVSRVFTYMVVPSVLVALAVYALARRIVGNKQP